MRGATLGRLALLAALLAAPWTLSAQWLGLLSQMGMAAVLCLSLWLLMGQGGMVSFGHALYSGLGGFVAVYTLQALAGSGQANLDWMAWMPVALTPLLAGLVVAMASWALGWLATRHHSSMVFAMITLGLGELAWVGAQMFPDVFGGEAGLSVDRTAGIAPGGINWGPAWQFYLLVLTYTLLTMALIRGYTQTPLGRLLNAVRDNPTRVSFMGYDPRRIRHAAFVTAGFFAGMAGALVALFNERVSTEALSSHRSALVLVFTLMGGLSSMSGAVLGGVLMVMATVVLSSWTPAWLLYMGLAFVMVLLMAPGGLAQGLPAMGRTMRLHPLGAVCLALAAAAAGGLVEMAYQLRLASTLGPEVGYLGLVLDAHAASHWLAGLGLTAAGALGWHGARTRGRGTP